jgi:fibronectin type 3 domain-containing protein
MESLRYLSSGLAALSAALVAVTLSAAPALAAGSVLTPSARTVQVGETIRLSVTGFKPCHVPESRAVLWDQNPLSYELVPGPFTANDFTIVFVVPSSPVGPHWIAAGCPAENGPAENGPAVKGPAVEGYELQQWVPVKVVAPAPALAPSPRSVQAGGTVTVTGSGFVLCTDKAGSTTVELSANGTPLATASGSNGAFQQAITVPSGTPAGPYPVTAQCSDQPGSDLTSTNVYVVTLALSPSSGIPGTTIRVTGAGFTQCHEVQLQLLRDTTQAVATSSPFVPANGSFTAEVTVPSSAAPGTDYQVDAGCYPAVGTSAAIAVEPFAVTSAVQVTVPGPPARLAAVPGNGQVTLSWAAPASDGGSPVTGYNLYAGTTPDFRGKPPLAKKVAGTAVTVTGLANGTIYYFMVTAVNGVGEGSGAEVRAVPVTVPGAPTGLAAVPGNGQVALSWAAPASDGGSPVTGYIIYQGTSPGGETGTPVKGSPVTGTSCTVTGLTNGTTYYFKVVAANAAGLSPLSEEASATLPMVSPSAPTSTAPTSTAPTSTAPTSTAPTSTAPTFAPPTGLAAAPGDTQVRLSWAAPASDGGSSVISYKVYIATTPDMQGVAPSGSTTSNDVTVTGLTNGTVYYFMVTAVNTTEHESPFSTEVSAEPVAATQPLVPLHPSAAATPLVALLAAVAAMAAATGFTLLARSRRRVRPRSRQETAVTPDVRAVPDTSRPDALGVRDTGQEPTHTVRFEPQPGVATTTMKEGRP